MSGRRRDGRNRLASGEPEEREEPGAIELEVTNWESEAVEGRDRKLAGKSPVTSYLDDAAASPSRRDRSCGAELQRSPDGVRLWGDGNNLLDQYLLR